MAVKTVKKNQKKKPFKKRHIPSRWNGIYEWKRGAGPIQSIPAHTVNPHTGETLGLTRDKDRMRSRELRSMHRPFGWDTSSLCMILTIEPTQRHHNR